MRVVLWGAPHVGGEALGDEVSAAVVDGVELGDSLGDVLWLLPGVSLEDALGLVLGVSLGDSLGLLLGASQGEALGLLLGVSLGVALGTHSDS
jgi:hypothetical protein